MKISAGAAEKAAGLYGALEDFVQQLPNPLPIELHQRFTNLGIKSFRTSKNDPSLK